MNTKNLRMNLTKQELTIIKLKLDGLNPEKIGYSVGLKEYEVRDILDKKHIKAELAIGYDEIQEEANDLIKASALDTTRQLINATTDPNVTGSNIKAIELILKKLGIIDNKIITENVNHNQNTNLNGNIDISEETAKKLKDIWDEMHGN